MRCYHFNNFYLAGIHAGIQSHHSSDELSLKYLVKKNHDQDEKVRESLIDWMDNHKTIVALNGGMHGDLLKIEAFLSRHANRNYPWASFRESEYALNNTLTNIALVLPEHLYAFKSAVNAAAEFKDNPGHELVDDDSGVRVYAGNGRVSIRRDVLDGSDFEEFVYDEFDLELIELMAPMKLM